MKSHVMKKVSSLALGSSMLILSMLPAASAFAQSAPTVTLTESGYNNIAAQVQPGQSVTFDASASGISNPMYQFWVEQPDGQWIDAQNYSSSSTFTLSNVQAGDYLVAVDVLSAAQLKAGDYSAAIQPLADGVFVDSSVTLSVPSASVVAGHTLTVSATATNIFDPLYQFWYKAPNGQWYQSGNYSSSNSFTFTPSMSGTYTFIAYAKSPLAVNDPEGALYSNTGSATVLPVVQVGLSDSASTLPNDGKTTDTFTAAVTDPNGNPMSGVAVTFTSSNPNVIALASGATATATTNASGVATVTGTAGTTVGTALVTAEADMQSSAPVTITTTQSPATQIGNVAVSPVVGTTSTQQTISGSTTTMTTYVGTAGTPETISAQIEDAQGNPVPGQTIVLTGNHVDTNTSVTPFRENSIQEPGSTTFTPFGSNEFGLATASASGMVSFTVENAANAYAGEMTTSSTVLFNGQYLPYNTYSFWLVPSGTTVTEGQPLPTGLTPLSGNGNNSGMVEIAWQPTHVVSTGLDIASMSSALPTDYSAADSSTTVVGPAGTPQFFQVQPYTTNNAAAAEDTAIEFMPPSGDALIPAGSEITYTITTNGHGVIDNIDGVKLNAGWTYDSTTGMWTSGSTSGVNFDSESVTVTYQYAKYAFGEAMNVFVSTPTQSQPLELAGLNPVFPDYGPSTLPGFTGVNTSPSGGPNSTLLTFGTNDGVAETTNVSVTASSSYLGISNPSPASATVSFTSSIQPPVSAVFTPSQDSNAATTLNDATITETVQVLDENGNPVPNTAVAFDGTVKGQGYTGYYDSPTSNDAIWVTKVDGTTLTNGSLPDAFPLVSNLSTLGSGTSSTNPGVAPPAPPPPSSTAYVAPSPVAGLYYANGATLNVFTSSSGMVALTLQGGQASYVADASSPTAEVSQNVTDNQFWVSAWYPATKTNLGYMTIGAPSSAYESPYFKITPTSNTVTTSRVTTYTVTMYKPDGNSLTTGIGSSDTIAVTLTPGSTPDGGYLTEGSTSTKSDTSGSVTLNVTLSGGTGTFTYTAPSTLPTSGTGTITGSDITNSQFDDVGPATISD